MIVARVVPKSELASTLDSLKNWYNGYKFSNTSFSTTSSGSEKPVTLYNPQLVFVHLEHTTSDGRLASYLDEANAVHNSAVLSAVGETGLVAIHDLTNMLVAKANMPIAHIMTELSFSELFLEQEKRPKNVTWSLLYYLGIVTFCEEIQGLRAPNCAMTHLVSLGRCLGGCGH